MKINNTSPLREVHDLLIAYATHLSIYTTKKTSMRTNSHIEKLYQPCELIVLHLIKFALKLDLYTYS